MAGDYTKVISGVTTSISVDADIGYTKGAIVIACDVNMGFIEVDQEPLPVDANILTKGFTISIPFAEATLTNIAKAWDCTVGTLGTVSSTPTLRAITIVQPGAVGTRTWTFTGCVAFEYGEHSTDNGANPVVMTTKFKLMKGGTGALTGV